MKSERRRKRTGGARDEGLSRYCATPARLLPARPAASRPFGRHVERGIPNQGAHPTTRPQARVRSHVAWSALRRRQAPALLLRPRGGAPGSAPYTPGTFRRLGVPAERLKPCSLALAQPSTHCGYPGYLLYTGRGRWLLSAWRGSRRIARIVIDVHAA
jgi:hypothetical protein